VAIRPKEIKTLVVNLVEREEIGEVVTKVIKDDEGREIRERIKKRIRFMKRLNSV
jgi:hypothetical protein